MRFTTKPATEATWPSGCNRAARARRLGSRFLSWPRIMSTFVTKSSLSWSLACVILRYRQRTRSHLTGAAYQMVLGGGGLALVGLMIGEARQLTPDRFTPGAYFSFFYLLLVGSLIGFVAFNFLLGHVSAAKVGTHAYVNPVVAILVGHFLGEEEITGWIVGGMMIILGGVALVRGGGKKPAELSQPLATEVLTGASAGLTNGVISAEQAPGSLARR